MIESVKKIFKIQGFECRGANSKNHEKGCYVTVLNRVKDEQHNKVVDRNIEYFVKRAFPTAQRKSHNHYFIDCNGIDFQDLTRFVMHNWHYSTPIDLSNKTEIRLDKLTASVVEHASPSIGYVNSEFVTSYDIGFDMLIFDSNELATICNDPEFAEHPKGSIQCLLNSEITTHTREIESDKYKNIGSKSETVEFTTYVRDVFVIDPSKYHVLVWTGWEVV